MPFHGSRNPDLPDAERPFVHHACPASSIALALWPCLSSPAFSRTNHLIPPKHASQPPLYLPRVSIALAGAVRCSLNLLPPHPPPTPHHTTGKGAVPQQPFRLHLHKRQSWYVLLSLLLLPPASASPNIPPSLSCFITIIIIRRPRARKASPPSHGTSPSACNAVSTKSCTLIPRAW